MPSQQRTQSTRSQPMQRAKVDGDGTELEYEVLGAPAGEPVVLIHGALLARRLRAAARRAGAGHPLPPDPLPPAGLRRQRPPRRADQHRAAGRRLPGAPGAPGRRAGPRRRPLLRRGHRAAAGPGRAGGRALPGAAGAGAHGRPQRAAVRGGGRAGGPGCTRPGTRRRRVDGFLRVAIGRDYRGLLDQVFPGGTPRRWPTRTPSSARSWRCSSRWRFTREDARRIDPARPRGPGQRERQGLAGLARGAGPGAGVAAAGRAVRPPRREPRPGVDEPPRGRRGPGRVLRPPPHPDRRRPPRSALTAQRADGSQPRGRASR